MRENGYSKAAAQLRAKYFHIDCQASGCSKPRPGLHKGKALHPVERVDMATGELFNDGEHILYVNGEYRDDSEIGKLMHDSSCWNPDEMSFDLLKSVTKYYKENPEGVEIMCRAFEETRNEAFAKGREQERIDSIRNIMDSMNISADQAMTALKIPPEDQAKYLAKL